MMQSFCNQCGTPLRPGQRFCTSCGAVCDAGAPAPAAPPVAAVQGGWGQGAPQEGLFSRLKRRIGGNHGISPEIPQVTLQSPPAVQGRPGDHGSVRLSPPEPMPIPEEWLLREIAPGGLDATGPLGVGGTEGADDYQTVLYVEDGPDDELTTVFSEEESYVLVRETTGERISIALPAILGKGSQATCLVKGNKSISRQHARVTCCDGQLQLEDLGSTNHTKVDGGKLVPGDPVDLEFGQEFYLSDEAFRVEKEEDGR